jgi:F-type H+-transporting ATPase subunit a
MSATQRGAFIFAIIIAVLFACGFFTTNLMPNTGGAPALPVIVLPAEPYVDPGSNPGFYWTNTLTATVLADLMVLIFLALAWRASNGWRREVPTRFQGFVELLGGFMYNQSKQMAGANARLVFPLVGSIFIFLLAVNWMKLLPGIESVGVMHCAGHSNPAIGINVNSGFPRVGDRLWVSRLLFTGFPADEETYHACEQFQEGHVAAPTQDALNAAAAELEEAEAAVITALDEQVAAGTLTADERDAQLEALRLSYTEELYEHAAVGLTPAELREGVVPYLYIVTPYVRGASTDLNLTFALALISFVAIQVFGVIAQGPNYFQKFINLRALGNAGKRPMGLMDFGVGLFEIISEFGKIISLSFRLFGNMFAGGVLLAVMSFLIAFLLPAVFIGLEVIVTTIQAYVFAVLTLLFSAQAMEGHHGEAEEHAH